MLTHRDRLAPALVDAQIHTAARANDLRVSRFGIVIDDHGHECGAVSQQYKLVRNADLVSAVDLVADNMGLELECESGTYRRGRSKYEFLLPNTWQVPGDESGLRSRFTLMNGYGGTDRVRGMGGTYRLICTNGMSVGDVVASMSQKHVGDFNIGDLVEDMMLRTIEAMSAEKARAIKQGQTPFEYNPHAAGMSTGELARRTRNNGLMVALGDDTPKRYHVPLVKAIGDYRENVGHTVWAITQAIAEIARHDRKDTPTAQAWARRNQTRILEAVGI